MPEQTLGLPYGPNSGYGSGTPNIGFIDLVNEPDRINEIPELCDFIELKELVSRINSKGMAFATYRVDSGIDFFPHESFDHTCFTFLTLGLRRMHPTQDRRVFEIFGDDFESKADLGIPHTKIVFRISPLTVPSIDLIGSCLDVFVHGCGFTTVSAKRAWLRGFLEFKSRFEDFHDRLINNEFDELVSRS